MSVSQLSVININKIVHRAKQNFSSQVARMQRKAKAVGNNRNKIPATWDQKFSLAL